MKPTPTHIEIPDRTVPGISISAASNFKELESRHEPEPRQMEENRRGEDHAVQAVHHAAVAFDHAAPVLHTTVALDGREDQPAQEAHQAGDEGEPRGLRWRKRRDP